ncbi:MAG: OsmC family protein [Candidatus Cloacimonetes bacterium]|nr:OsmC family protein [Candidatus Cloacimonadota bacterium]
MSYKVVTKWAGGMLFDANIGGHHVLMDSDKEFGGQDQGARPKPLLFAALAGCSGIDVVSILTKMQVKDYTFEIDTEGESTTEHPIIYHTITVKFLFSGNDLPPDKIKKAVNLSTERYCGVIAMLSKAANIIVKIYINNTEVS